MRVPHPLTPLLALTLLVAPPPLLAQAVSGHVLERGTRAPVVGAFVALLDDDGAARAAGLTDARGAFILTADGTGRYRLRVYRIGYETTVTAAHDVPPDGLSGVVVEVSGAAVDLGSISVAGQRRCELTPDEGQSAWRLWSETRKALEVTRWTEARRSLRFTVIHYHRTVLPDSMIVAKEIAWLSQTVARRAFVSDGPERLATLGYVRGDTESREYFLPDAEVLLSDGFLDSHCFRSVGRGDDGWVGLAFEPLDPEAVSEVEGTLWLDPGSAELRALDVRYVRPGLPGDPDPERFGGRIEFRRLPDGAWIVSRWRIRMPLFRQAGWFRSRYEVAHFEEEEAEVLAVSEADGGGIPFARHGAVVLGRAHYAAEGEPVVGASVGLEGTPYRTTTDGEGRFVLEGLPAHRYRLVLEHPALPGGVPARDIVLARGDTVRLEIRAGADAGADGAGTEAAGAEGAGRSR